MDAFERLYQDAWDYPMNLRYVESSSLPDGDLEAVQKQLLGFSGVTFCGDDAEGRELLVLDISPLPKGDVQWKLRHANELDDLLRAPLHDRRRESLDRIFYICGPNSRARLLTPLSMVQRLFSHHQVLPAFVDKISSFGAREYSPGCKLSSLVTENRLFDSQKGLQIETIGRSGREIKLCYNLRAVEFNKEQTGWPWSIRQCSVHHSLDLTSAQAVWIIVKANSLMKYLVKDVTDNPKFRHWLERDNVSGGLAAAMATHHAIAAWSTTLQWTRYIADLEESLQKMTRLTLDVDLEPEKISKGVKPLDSPTTPNVYQTSPFRRQPVVGRSWSAVQSAVHRRFSAARRLAMDDNEGYETVARHQFSFSDLRGVHQIEEMAVEASGILRNNHDVLQDLSDSYNSVIGTLQSEWDNKEAVIALQTFKNDLEGLRRQLSIWNSRLSMLLRLLSDRKALLQSILNFESMVANRDLAEKAHTSALKMEHIAVKTKLETVLMRIITLVTLCFLPGTFVSTLMSTTVITFRPGSELLSQGEISWGAVYFFLLCSLPLLLITTGVSAMFYVRARRTEKRGSDSWKKLEAAGQGFSIGYGTGPSFS